MLQGIFDIFQSVGNAFSGLISFFSAVGNFIKSFFDELPLFFKSLGFARSFLNTSIPLLLPLSISALFFGIITVIIFLRILNRT